MTICLSSAVSSKHETPKFQAGHFGNNDLHSQTMRVGEETEGKCKICGVHYETWEQKSKHYDDCNKNKAKQDNDDLHSQTMRNRTKPPDYRTVCDINYGTWERRNMHYPKRRMK